MKQVVLRQNKVIDVIEIQRPICGPGELLVQNHYSVISAGTEAAGIAGNQVRTSVLDQLRAKPSRLLKGVQKLMADGIQELRSATEEANRIGRALGYSTVGHVVEVGSQINRFKPGDLLACAGSGIASHAEMIVVPANLVVKLPENTDEKQAAFTTIASIALQGVRQANVELGDRVLVIGLGLIGMITAQLLKISGAHVLGLDIDERRVDFYRNAGFENGFVRSDSETVNRILGQTLQHGVDKVIITASTSSSEPLNFSMKVTRRKGTVVIVGAVGMELERAEFYKKEIDLRISSSYGPGRYDPEYETLGVDYPYAYVRWTENRNMQAILEFISNKQLDFTDLITEIYSIDNAKAAYSSVKKPENLTYGVLFEYRDQINAQTCIETKSASDTKAIDPFQIGIIGLGGFVTRTYIQFIKADSRFKIRGIANRSPLSAAKNSERYNPDFTTTDAKDLIGDQRVASIIIGTHHDTHATMASAAIRAGKNVICEKPAGISLAEVSDLEAALVVDETTPIFAVGYNRRYSPHIARVRSELSENGPLLMIYRINAGFIPGSHWTQDPKEGGGRLIGEGCHFFDVFRFLDQSPLISAAISVIEPGPVGNPNPDNYIVQLKFRSGTVATLSYVTIGGPDLKKEYLEVHQGRKSWVIDDYQKLITYGDKVYEESLPKQDKGHKQQFEEWTAAISGQTNRLISVQDSLWSTKLAILLQSAVVERRNILSKSEIDQLNN